MTGWIVLGVCLLAVLVLILSVVPLLRRIGQLREIEYRLRQRAEEAQRLTPALEALQRRAAKLERSLRGVQERAEGLAEKRAAAKRHAG